MLERAGVSAAMHSHFGSAVRIYLMTVSAIKRSYKKSLEVAPVYKVPKIP